MSENLTDYKTAIDLLVDVFKPPIFKEDRESGPGSWGSYCRFCNHGGFDSVGFKPEYHNEDCLYVRFVRLLNA